MALTLERRRHPRYVLPVACVPIRLRTLDTAGFPFEGHAYDVSEGGIRFELNRPFEPGTKVAVEFALPEWASPAAGRPSGPGRAVFAFATIAWIADEDEPAPVRMAAFFTGFARAGDRERLLSSVTSGRYRLAA